MRKKGATLPKFLHWACPVCGLKILRLDSCPNCRKNLKVLVMPTADLVEKKMEDKEEPVFDGAGIS